MIERAYIHVAGPKGAGKTTLVEAILAAFDGPAIAVRCRRNDKLAESVESSPARDVELRRYREAGASGAARFEFPSDEEDGDGFFCSKVMCDYSKAVVIEGDCPVEYVDLEVFVAPPLPAGTKLLARSTRPATREAVDAIEMIVRGIGAPDLRSGRVRQTIENAIAIYDESFGRKHRAQPTWTLAPAYRGLENAGLVVVNVRAGEQRAAADAMLGEIARIRSDDAVRTSILGRFGHRIPVTTVVADLANPKDLGTKKAMARVRRAIARRGRP